MPYDNYRVQGPKVSVPYQQFIETPPQKKLVKNGKRLDGRQPEQMRPMFLDTGIVGQAKGSAYIEMGNTKVVAAVYGPREIARKSDFRTTGVLKCYFRDAPFSTGRRKLPFDDDATRRFDAMLQDALLSAVRVEAFPKAQVDVYVEALENDGGLLAAAITCASLALCNANLEMYGVPVATSMSLWDDVILMDPCFNEQYDPAVKDVRGCSKYGNITVGWMPESEQVVSLSHEGNVDSKTLFSSVSTLVESSGSVTTTVNNYLIELLKRK